MRKIVSVSLLALILASSAFAAPKNIILMIGDGMGIAHVMATRIATGGPGTRLQMDSMPVAGLVTTYSANALITDSAAAGTAFATGEKTSNGTISQTPDGKRLRSILEAAQELRKSTGLVTMTAIVDATPAVFASHVASRSQAQEIANQMAASGANLLFGGGKALFIPKSIPGSSRTDERDLLAEAKAKGCRVVETADQLASVNGGNVIGLFGMGNLTGNAPEPPLSQMAAKAIELLSTDKDGFFLMVEGGNIDHYAHANQIDGVIRDTAEFDRAVGKALEFARSNKNTLVIVTSDHETGGLTLLTDEKGNLKPAWSTGGHSATPVALYAYGPDSGRFAGFIDNTDIARTMAAIWHAKIGLQGSTGIPTTSSSSVTALPSVR